jgi:hypothetical protein
MGDLAEDRVYDDHADDDAAYLATATGVARVAVANGRVGRFGLEHRCEAADLAATSATEGGETLVAVATDEDVLVHRAGGAPVESRGTTDDEWPATGYGPAEAVGFDATEVGHAALVAASADEHAVGRVLDPAADPADWLTVADVDAPVRAVAGPFLAAADGCYRLTPDAVEDVGLDDVRDVAVPAARGHGGDRGGWTSVDALAATGDGCYRLVDADGETAWERDLDGEFAAVAIGPGRAVAVGDAGAFLHDGDGWAAVDTPAPPVDVGVGQTVYGVTGDGTFLAREAEGWRTRALGLPAVRAMAVLSGGG